MTKNITVQVATDNIPRSTQYVYEILQPHITEGQAKYIQDIGELALSMVFPLKARGKTIGVMIFSLSKKSPKLTKNREEMIERVLKVVGIALDNASLYSELRELSEELQSANLKLKELDKLKDEFVSVASHELRTPMTAIRSYVWMALHRSDIPLSQKLQRYLYRTFISTERLINLVSDMLNLSRIESGKIEINPVSLNLTNLVNDIIEDVRIKADEKRIKILVLEEKVPPVFADPEKLQQILLNLLGNALKFTFPGGTIAISFFTDGKVVEISIKDSGQGIAREDMGKLFKKFGRLDASYVSISSSGGTGLGLYISRSLIELMHGRIWAESEGIEKGSKFSFSLPVATAQVLEKPEDFHIQAQGVAKG